MTKSPNTPTITFDSWGETLTAHPRIQHYSNGRLAIELWHEVHEDDFSYMEPVGKVTVNMPDDHLNEGEVFVKDWAENEHMIAALLEQGWLIPAGRETLSGYVAPAVMRPAGPLADFIAAQD